jgi:hypothetical protein
MPWLVVGGALTSAGGAVIGGALTGAGSIIGASKASGAQKSAAEASAAASVRAAEIEAQSAKEALEWEKQKDAEALARYNEYRAQRQPFVNNALAILEKYHPGASKAYAGASGPANAIPEASTGARAGGSVAPSTAGSTLGDLAGVPKSGMPTLPTTADIMQPQTAALTAPRLTLANLAGWNKWGA